MRVNTARRDARLATRLDVRIPAHVRQRGSTHRFLIDIVDLSATGFRCRTAFTLHVGDRLALFMPSFAPLDAVVQWSHDFCYGCAFDHSLHVAVFDHIVARYAPPAD